MITVVADKQSLLTLLKENSAQIHSFGIAKLGIFGSFARNSDIHEESDIDFLVDFKKGQKTFHNLVELGNFLENLLGRRVELVTRKSLKPPLGTDILKTVENVSI